MSSFCNICFDTFCKGIDVLPTPCGHIFHKICLAMHVKDKQSCPQCSKTFSSKDLQDLGIELTTPGRRPVPQNYGEPENKSYHQGRPRGTSLSPVYQPALKRYPIQSPRSNNPRSNNWQGVLIANSQSQAVGKSSFRSSSIMNLQNRKKENIPPERTLKMVNLEKSSKVIFENRPNLTIMKVNKTPDNIQVKTKEAILNVRPRRESTKRGFGDDTPHRQASSALMQNHIQPVQASSAIKQNHVQSVQASSAIKQNHVQLVQASSAIKQNHIQPVQASSAIKQTHIQPVLSNETSRGNLKWGTIIPLVGGSAIGCSRSAGNLPAFHLTYTPFTNNQTHLDRYWPQVPKYYIDKNQEPENMEGNTVFF